MRTFATLLVFFMHIDAGPADKTLQLMAAQTNVDTLYDHETAPAYLTHAVRGTYGLFEGWCAFLEGSDLTFTYSADMNYVSVEHEAHPGDRDALCQDKPNGWGPDFIHPPVADWK